MQPWKKRSRFWGVCPQRMVTNAHHCNARVPGVSVVSANSYIELECRVATQQAAILPIRPNPSSTRWSPLPAKKFFIQGVTLSGKTFRPSDLGRSVWPGDEEARPGGGAPWQPPQPFPLGAFPPRSTPSSCVVVNRAPERPPGHGLGLCDELRVTNELQLVEACPAADPPPTRPDACLGRCRAGVGQWRPCIPTPPGRLR